MDIRNLTVWTLDERDRKLRPPIAPIEEPFVFQSWIDGYRFGKTSLN
jgi:hypothetical protein